LKDSNLTAPDLVGGDFSAAGLQYAKNDKDRCSLCRVGSDYFILYYNKDCSEKGRAVRKPSMRWSLPRNAHDPKEGTFGSSGAVAQRQYDAVDELTS